MTRLLSIRHFRSAFRASSRLAGVLLVMLALPGWAHADGPADGEPYSSIVSFEGAADSATFSSAVAYVADCAAGQLPPSCGNPPARWSAANRPVQMCSFEANRPAWLTAEQFRQVVANAAAIWDNVEAGVGVRYGGDCTAGTTWTNNNQRNEIGFDDTRNAVAGSAAAVTRTSTTWSPPTNPTLRVITEADLIIDDQFPSLPACFNTTVIHEMGHVLGFGHSADPADVMYASFNPSDPSSCHQGPSANEQVALQNLYGINRRPAVTGGIQAATAGNAVTLGATAVDPDGDLLTYQWTQTGGPAVALSSPTAASPTFTAPVGATLQFQVIATDTFMHTGTATVTVNVTSIAGTPTATATAAPSASPTATASTTGSANLTGLVPVSGIGLFVFPGGTSQQLLASSGCPAATATFWATENGNFVIYVPGTAISAVNEGWFSKFPTAIPTSTPLLGRCHS